MCIRYDQHWHCHYEHGGCKGKLDKDTADEPIPSKWEPCEKARRTGTRCEDVTVVRQHLSMCCPMHHSRRIQQLDELWQDEWKNQVFDYFVQKQKHLSKQEKTDWRRVRDLQKERWAKFEAGLEDIYAQLGNELNDDVIRIFGTTFYERIEQSMLSFVNRIRLDLDGVRARRQQVLQAQLEREERGRQAAAAAAEVAAAAAGPPPLIPPKSSKRRQRSLTSVREGDLMQVQDALRQMALSGVAGASAPAQTRPLPPIPTLAQAGYTVARAPVAAAITGPSFSSSASGHDDDATLAVAASIDHVFRPPPRGSSTALSSDEDSESEDEKRLLSRDL